MREEAHQHSRLDIGNATFAVLKTRQELDIKNNILETIGNTPMIKLNKIAEDIPGTILAKVEYFNPGHSVKDRMALKMVEDAGSPRRHQAGGGP